EAVAFHIEGEELLIRSPFAMLGYLDAPEQTRAAREDGYFRTGDLARMRSDGRVELVGRSKDIVSRGGIKIAPLEIDNILAEHPDIAAALSAGVPDERLGEVIHAVVVLRPLAVLRAHALRPWVLPRTQPLKGPDGFYFTGPL